LLAANTSGVGNLTNLVGLGISDDADLLPILIPLEKAHPLQITFRVRRISPDIDSGIELWHENHGVALASGNPHWWFNDRGAEAGVAECYPNGWQGCGDRNLVTLTPALPENSSATAQMSLGRDYIQEVPVLSWWQMLILILLVLCCLICCACIKEASEADDIKQSMFFLRWYGSSSDEHWHKNWQDYEAMEVYAAPPASSHPPVDAFTPQDSTEQDLWELFQAMDQNHDGFVNHTDFIGGLWGPKANGVLKDLGVTEHQLSGTGHEVVKELFDMADRDATGTITFSQFLAAFNQKLGGKLQTPR
jgi:hypothetical protein